MGCRVAMKIFEDFGGVLCKEFIIGQKPVSTVHYARPGIEPVSIIYYTRPGSHFISNPNGFKED